MQRIRKGDLVEVIAGDDRGVRGEVNRVMPRENRVVIHGANLVKKHQRRTGSVRTHTGIIEFEAPVQLSNVQPVCPTCDRPVRVRYRRLPEGGGVRTCGRCGHAFD
jgi:large subunit ribosomal protein L24